MADYQKVETHEDAGDAAFSEADLEGLKQEAADQEAAQQAKLEEETQREAQITGEERPEWLPEKFDSAEAMAKAYSDLESKFTKDQQEGSETLISKGERDSESPSVSLDDFAEFNTEFAETGDISEDSRAKIEGWGIPREMIDGYIKGQQAMLDTHFRSIYEEVGGESNYENMISWAKESLPPGDQTAFNEAVVNGTPEQMMFAIRSTASRWRAETGTPSTMPLIQGDTGSAGASGSFQSVAQLTEAMRDPRYTKDPAYRKDIETRLSHSNIF